MLRFFAFALSVLFSFNSFAREGMWIPLLLEKYNINEMQQMGFELSSSQIFNKDSASIKDAVVIFGRGCTGSIISSSGLLLTNFHCAHSSIQKHSSISNDYLTDGFWAMSSNEELLNADLSVTFIKSMHDVTELVLKGVSDSLDIKERNTIIKNNIDSLTHSAIENTHYIADVESFYFGNQFFLILKEVFKDVRLVGAPPSSIGKLGGDTDNWMWPRHNADFALFRVYADENNLPAEYSPNNVPYKPKHFLPISLNGVEEDDFTLVMGFPGSTSQYVTSHHVKMLTHLVYPTMYDVRSERLKIMNEHMRNNPEVRIKYASKYASLSNAWKRWDGEIKGLRKLKAIESKQKYENDFKQWGSSDSSYNTLIDDFEKIYEQLDDYRMARDLLLDVIGGNGLETLRLASMFEPLTVLISNNDTIAVAQEKQRLNERIERHFQDFYLPVELEIMPLLLKKMRDVLDERFLVDFTEKIEKKYKGDMDKYAYNVISNSTFSNYNSTLLFLNKLSNSNLKDFRDDSAYELFNSLRAVYYYKVLPTYNQLNSRLDSLNRVYINALKVFDGERQFFPDANFTMRVSYGQVKGYEANDAVVYKYNSTLQGVIEKNNPDNYDYKVPKRLRELYRLKDFGRYDVNGILPVCFVATNHTTGGNSGSPVLNKRGELVGVNFDRGWDGVMSDIMFSDDQSRNISVDIRYVLFLIDIYAKASYLLNEMHLIN